MEVSMGELIDELVTRLTAEQEFEARVEAAVR